MKQNVFAYIIIGVLCLSGGFFAGMQYQKSQQSSRFAQFANRQPGEFTRQAGTTGMRGGLRPVTGVIVKADDTSITVKLSDGSTKIVLISATTHINKAEAAGKNDLSTGTQIAAFGSENTDGSVTAQTIQINPELNMRGGMQPSPTPGK